MIYTSSKKITKIAYIYPALSTVGGADRIITEKANYFADIKGYDVSIITTHQNGTQIYFPLSPKVNHIDLDINFNTQYKHSFLIRGWIYFKLLRKYKKKLSETLLSLRPDFTITTISRDIDFLTSIKDGSIKIAEAHNAKPFLRNLHLMQQRGFPYQIISKIWTKKIEKAISNFSALVVLTEKDMNDWDGILKATVIPNSVAFYPSRVSDCKNKRIISIGRLTEQKGYDLLINAWVQIAKKYPEWELVIYGEGEDYYKLKREIEKLNLQNSFILNKPVSNIMDKYLNSSFYVLSSRFEGFGLVLIEAMACGLPCIAFDCPNGPADIIKNGEDGILVKNGDIEALIQAMEYFICNPDIREKMGKMARQNVQRYKREIIMQKWISLFESLKQS